MIIARVFVTLKSGILDPQGKAVHHALTNLGIGHIDEVRMGKIINLHFADVTEKEARRLAEDACQKLLANPVIEEYKIELLTEDAAPA